MQYDKTAGDAEKQNVGGGVAQPSATPPLRRASRTRYECSLRDHGIDDPEERIAVRLVSEDKDEDTSRE